MHVRLQQEHFLIALLFPLFLRNGFISYPSSNHSWLLMQCLEKVTHAVNVQQTHDCVQAAAVLAPGKAEGTFSGILLCY